MVGPLRLTKVARLTLPVHGLAPLGRSCNPTVRLNSVETPRGIKPLSKPSKMRRPRCKKPNPVTLRRCLPLVWTVQLSRVPR